MIGGWIALASGGSAWVFWALVLFGAIVLIVVGIALPETARNVVGNGSLEATGWSRSWLMISRLGLHRGSKSNEITMDEGRFEHRENQNASNNHGQATFQKKRFKMMAPWAALRIIFYKDTALVLWMAASPYAVWYCIQASIPPIYQDIYAFNEIQIGLSYLTGGLGTVLGGYASGKLMDWNYQTTAKQLGHTIDGLSGDDLENFPIERARARGSCLLLFCYIGALTGYGWSVNAHVHESLPLILQFMLAAICTSFQQTFNALLVDIFPKSPSTAAASSNITRCLLSAAAVAVVQPLSRSIGRSWFFTSLALLSGGGGLAADWSLKKYGMQWRRERIAKAKQSESHNATKDADHVVCPEARSIADEKSEPASKVCYYCYWLTG